MNYRDKVITLNNGNKYIVVEQVDYENGIYLYLSNRDDKLDNIVVKVNGDSILQIDPELYETKILPLFLEKFKTNN